MKPLKVAMLVAVSIMMAGCASTPTTVVMENAFQRKVITPCDNDIFCLKSNYSVTWDYVCTNCIAGHGGYPQRIEPNYPVSYKNSEYVVETGSEGYLITMPSGGAIRP